MYEQIKLWSPGNRIKTPEPGRSRSEGESRRTRDDTIHHVATKNSPRRRSSGSKFDAIAVCLFPPPVRRRFLFSFCCSLPRLQRRRTARFHTRSRLPRFEAAIEQGTRTASGRPGPNYWTNRASYDIDATLSPATNTVMGQETIILLSSSGSHLQA